MARVNEFSLKAAEVSVTCESAKFFQLQASEGLARLVECYKIGFRLNSEHIRYKSLFRHLPFRGHHTENQAGLEKHLKERLSMAVEGFNKLFPLDPRPGCVDFFH